MAWRQPLVIVVIFFIFSTPSSGMEVKWTSPVSNIMGKRVYSISRIPESDDLVLFSQDTLTNRECVSRISKFGFPVWEILLNNFSGEIKEIQVTPDTIYYTGINNDFLYCIDPSTGNVVCQIKNETNKYDLAMRPPILWRSEDGKEKIILGASQHINLLNNAHESVFGGLSLPLLATIGTNTLSHFMDNPIISGKQFFFPAYNYTNTKAESYLIGSFMDNPAINWMDLSDKKESPELSTFSGFAANNDTLFYTYLDANTNSTFVAAHNTQNETFKWLHSAKNIPDISSWEHPPKIYSQNSIIIDKNAVYLPWYDTQISSPSLEQQWPFHTAIVALHSSTGAHQWTTLLPADMFDIRRTFLTNTNQLICVGSALINPDPSPWKLTAKNLPHTPIGMIVILNARSGEILESSYLPSQPLASQMYQNGVVISYMNNTVQYIDLGKPTFEKPNAPWPSPDADGYNSRITRDTRVPPEMDYLRVNP